MSEWVSVKDRLPEIYEEVIVFGVGKADGYIGSTQMAITSMTDKNPLWPSLKWEKEWRDPWQYFLVDYEITHWMPLPEPPKGPALPSLSEWLDSEGLLNYPLNESIPIAFAQKYGIKPKEE